MLRSVRISNESTNKWEIFLSLLQMRMFLRNHRCRVALRAVNWAEMRTDPPLGYSLDVLLLPYWWLTAVGLPSYERVSGHRWVTSAGYQHLVTSSLDGEPLRNLPTPWSCIFRLFIYLSFFLFFSVLLFLPFISNCTLKNKEIIYIYKQIIGS